MNCHPAGDHPTQGADGHPHDPPVARGPSDDGIAGTPCQACHMNRTVDLYPGAEIRKNGAASASFGGFHTVSVTADTDDPVDRVTSFYKSKFPNAMVTTSDSGHCTIVSNDHKNIVTIVIEAAGDKTKIQISNVHKGSSDSSSN